MMNSSTPTMALNKELKPGSPHSPGVVQISAKNVSVFYVPQIATDVSPFAIDAHLHVAFEGRLAIFDTKQRLICDSKFNKEKMVKNKNNYVNSLGLTAPA